VKLFSLKGLLYALIGIAVFLLIAVQIVNKTPSLHTEGVVKDAVDAYIYGYPLIVLKLKVVTV